MTPQEKANQLVAYYLEYVDDNSRTYLNELNNAKQCALIAINEIAFVQEKYFGVITEGQKQYWQEVKQAINNL